MCFSTRFPVFQRVLLSFFLTQYSCFVPENPPDGMNTAQVVVSVLSLLVWHLMTAVAGPGRWHNILLVYTQWLLTPEVLARCRCEGTCSKNALVRYCVLKREFSSKDR